MSTYDQPTPEAPHTPQTMNRNEPRIEWRTWPEAFALFVTGATLTTCIPIALVVGLLLSTINQGDVIAIGSATAATWLKVGMNFVIPFCVSSYGFLNGCRSESPRLVLPHEFK